MSNEADRMSRAGNYVLGLMNPAERERAERDLERDAAFRDAVLRIAERMRIVGAPPDAAADTRWTTISSRIADLPQMRGQKFSENGKPVLQPMPGRGRTIGIGLHAVPLWRGAIVAGALIVAFALGYVIGVSALMQGAAKPAIEAGESADTP